MLEHGQRRGTHAAGAGSSMPTALDQARRYGAPASRRSVERLGSPRRVAPRSASAPAAKRPRERRASSRGSAAICAGLCLDWRRYFARAMSARTHVAQAWKLVPARPAGAAARAATGWRRARPGRSQGQRASARASSPRPATHRLRAVDPADEQPLRSIAWRRQRTAGQRRRPGRRGRSKLRSCAKCGSDRSSAGGCPGSAGRARTAPRGCHAAPPCSRSSWYRGQAELDVCRSRRLTPAP